MNHGRSLSSENTGGATGARGMKNGDLESGCTWLIADAERVPSPCHSCWQLLPFPLHPSQYLSDL